MGMYTGTLYVAYMNALPKNNGDQGKISKLLPQCIETTNKCLWPRMVRVGRSGGNGLQLEKIGPLFQVFPYSWYMFSKKKPYKLTMF